MVGGHDVQPYESADAREVCIMLTALTEKFPFVQTAKDVLESAGVAVRALTNADPGEEAHAVPVPGADDGRVQIGCHYNQQPIWKLALGVPLIYGPLLTTLPFMLPGVLLVKTHLKLVGGHNLKPFSDFLPAWASHRYQYHNQITLRDTRIPLVAEICKTRAFWIFNCKMYCPVSVATFSYMAYMVKIVENWWCPFNHERKADYADGAIDASFWHVNDELDQLHPEDADNPIWS